MTVYLDCNASTPIEPRVLEAMVRCYSESVGNAGSPHAFGQRAKERIHQARDQVAAVVGARRHEVFFTSGATESNNLAILGLAAFGRQHNRRHVITSAIEHHAVLEPIQQLQRQGFEVTWIDPRPDGAVVAEDIVQAIRADTLLISLMHVNNETGIRQPIGAIADAVHDLPVFFHVDAAQGFGKDLGPLCHPGVGLISVSGHKIHGPQGIGSLIARRRAGALPPLEPLMFGGGQELGWRPGTLPVALIVGLGLAAELAAQEVQERAAHCQGLREIILSRLAPLQPRIHGDLAKSLPHVLNVSIPGVDADQAIDALWDIAAISDGAACTSVCATSSHVLAAMGVSGAEADGAVRLSWSHLADKGLVLAAVDRAIASLLILI